MIRHQLKYRSGERPNRPAAPVRSADDALLDSAPSDGVVIACPGGAPIAGADLALLEELDDSIFAALEGDADALERAIRLWPAARREIEPPLIEEALRQYARRAESVWRAYQANPAESLPQAFAALEVLGLVAE